VRVVIAATVTAATSVAALLHPWGAAIGPVNGDWLHIAVFTMAAAIIAARAVIPAPGRGVWIAFAAAAGLNVLGQALWMLVWADAPQSPADGAFAACQIAYAVGLALFLRRRVVDALWTLATDALGCTLCLMAVGLAVALHPMQDQGAGGIAAVLNVFYPAADAATCAIVFATTSFIGGRRGRQDLLLTGAFAAMLAADVAYAVTVAGWVPVPDAWQNAGWELALLGIAGAAWSPSAIPGRLRVGGWWEAAPTIAWMLVGGGVLVAAWRWHLPTGAVVLAALTLVLACVRCLTIVREVRSLVVERAESLVDPTTGLANQRALFEELALLTREGGRDGRRAAMIVCDLTGYRELTDALGHVSARRLLRAVGERLAPAVPGRLARLTADAFAVLVEDDDPFAVAEAMDRALAEPITLDGTAVVLRPVAGVARFPEDAVEPAQLARCADVARRDARARGLPIAAYDPARDGHSRERLQLAADLREALERDPARDAGHGLWVAYQPQVDLRTGAVAGVEALVRWRHPLRGELWPDDFLAVARDSGQMTALTDWVLQRATGDLAALREVRGEELRVSVNVSAVSLVDVGLPGRIAAALEQAGLPPGGLVIEVTEDAVMADRVRCREVLQEIAALGVELALDDFGTGHSSLGQLQVLDARELKIDRSFVQAPTSESFNNEVVGLVIGLSRALGIRVVAEGVETPEQQAWLASLGCDLGQGFGLGRPMELRRLVAWLDRSPANV
jgi:diguanylate cyclase (GGDEF)-like protein